MSKQLTTIQTRIEGDAFTATTPHVPELKAQGESEAAAVNQLMAAVRIYIAAHPAGVPWIVEPDVKPDRNVITRRLSGLWPAVIAATEATAETETPIEQELDHG